MSSSIKPTIRSPITILSPGLTLRTAVTVYALRIITIQTKMTGRHSRNGRQDEMFFFGQFVRMVMVAMRVGAFA